MKESKIVFIDRDGVINVDPIGDYVKNWEEFKFEKGALEGLRNISDLGLEIILISNQAGVGDGVYPEQDLWDIHGKMLKEFERNGIKIRSSHYCLHGKNAGCSCRKPETGLFEQAVKGLVYDSGSTYFIGDKASDVKAGRRFGLRTIFVRTGHGRFDEPKLKGDLRPDFIVNNLQEAAEILAK
ncbi:MAG TPA: HAD family hydrolase [bacterium]|nr:HAD family hydrolase [bacterium]